MAVGNRPTLFIEMEKDALFEVLPLFTANMESRKRIKVNQGGTSSGKTYSIMQVLFLKAMQTCGMIITVVGQKVLTVTLRPFGTQARHFNSGFQRLTRASVSSSVSTGALSSLTAIRTHRTQRVVSDTSFS